MSLVIFLDRDGTIVQNKHYLADPAELELLPGAAEGLRRMQAMGASLVVVTNQSGVARGLFPAESVVRVHERLRGLLAAESVTLDGIYACLHSPEDGCVCRKPKTGMAVTAAAELALDMRNVAVIGDRDCDVEFGRNLGARTLQIGVDVNTLIEAAAALSNSPRDRARCR